MLTERIDQERCIGFYYWALADAEQGVRQQYPLLRGIQNVHIINYLRTIEGMRIEKQLRLAKALVNHAHSTARKLLGESSSSEEQTLIEDYRFDARLQESAIKQELYDKSLKGSSYQRRRFAKRILNKLEPIFGRPEHECDQQWIFVTAITGWYIGTRVELRKPTQTLRYWQSVMAAPNEYPGQLESPSQNGTNILAWLGLGRTEIQILCAQDEELASESLANICLHYLAGMTGVLSGLTAEVMKKDEWDGIHWWQKLPIDTEANLAWVATKKQENQR